VWGLTEQTGDTRDRDLWHEYKRATRSLAAVRWPRGLRAMKAGSVTEPERSDEELAAADIGGNLIVVIQCPVWSRARTAGLEHAVLVAADDGGLEAVNALISEALSGEACLAPTLSGCTIE
jgi:hypothetical protein